MLIPNESSEPSKSNIDMPFIFIANTVIHSGTATTSNCSDESSSHEFVSPQMICSTSYTGTFDTP